MKIEKALLHTHFYPYEPFPRAKDRGGWKALPEELKGSLVKRGEAYAGYEFPSMSAVDWLLYTREADRAKFEGKYFDKRYALCALVLAECVEGEGRFLDDILNGVWNLCEESGWQFPAHNNYVRDGAVLPFPDRKRPVVDLFAAETGAHLACLLYLVGDNLDGISPMVTQRIRDELFGRIIEPYLKGWFWWMGGRGESTLNWTVWCTQNVLLTAFLAPFDEETRFAVAEKAVESLNHFLDGYGDDGCCDEGAGYYHHAGVCLFTSLDILDSITRGRLKAVFKEPKLKNMAQYIQNVHVDDKYYINFADCSPVAGRAGVKEYLFAKRCGLEEMEAFAVQEWNRMEEKELPQDMSLFTRTQAAFMHRELVEKEIPKKINYRDIFYESVGLMVARDSRFCLAVKAGGNDDSHNHNDTGSLTLYKDGLPFLIDIGVETYTGKTFSEKRYEIWTMQSSWHNLPDFDGVMQEAGAWYRATHVETELREDSAFIRMELKEAWPETAGLDSYVRKVRLVKGSHVQVEDACDGSYKAGVLNLMFASRPELGAGEIRVGELGHIQIDGGEKAMVEEVPMEDPRLRLAWPEKLYRVRISFKNRIKLSIL